MTPTKGLSQRLYNNIDTKAFVSAFLRKRKQMGSAGFSVTVCECCQLLTEISGHFGGNVWKKMIKILGTFHPKKLPKKSYKRGRTFSDFG
jgi:hypothetical protein